MGQLSVKQKLPTKQVRRLKRQVSFSEVEIQDWYREFLRSTNGNTDEDPHLSLDEFIKVYNSVYPGQCQDFAKHVFRTFDLNGDGKVDFREFLIGLSFSGSSDFEKKLSWAFSVYDVKKRGYITKTEMILIISSVYQMIGSQVLLHNDVKQKPEDLAEDIFRLMDSDGDQQISWDEFRRGASENPTVLRLLECSPPGGSTEGD